MTMTIDAQRRRLLGATLCAGALSPWASLSFAGNAGADGRRLAVVILRGGMDGLSAVPLVLRGPGTIDTWAPSALPDPSAELVMRLERMYGSDAALATALARAKALHLDGAMMAAMEKSDGPAKGATLLAQRAAEFLS